MKNTQKTILSLSLCFVLFFVCSFVLADTVTIPNPLPVATLKDLIKTVADFIGQLALVLLPLFIVWGGLRILTAGGDPNAVKAGREIILWAVVGFLIAKLASVLVDAVVGLFPPAP
jgi:hypothetical protein